MQIISIPDLLDNDRFDFDRSKEELSLSEQAEIKASRAGLSYLFSEPSELAIESFVRYFLTQFLTLEQPVFLFFSESFPEPKSRLRSYQQLFYQETDAIGTDNYFTYERELPEGQSLLVGVIQVTADNLAYAIERLFTSEFVFGFTEATDEEAIHAREELRPLFDQSVMIDKRRWLNPLRLALHLPTEKAVAFRLLPHGNDDQSLDLFLWASALPTYIELGERFLLEGEGVTYV